MTKDENRQRIKNETLNKIVKMYSNNNNFHYDQYDDSSYAEQRELEIGFIIDKMKRELNKIKF